VTTKTNLAASISARLLNQTRKTGADYQTLLTSYCLERFLYRLSVSDRRDRFVLKGAMLLRLWSDQPYRATRDLDLLRRGDGAFEAIRDDLEAIVATPVPDDWTFTGIMLSMIERCPIRDTYDLLTPTGITRTKPAGRVAGKGEGRRCTCDSNQRNQQISSRNHHFSLSVRLRFHSVSDSAAFVVWGYFKGQLP